VIVVMHLGLLANLYFGLVLTTAVPLKLNHKWVQSGAPTSLNQHASDFSLVHVEKEVHHQESQSCPAPNGPCPQPNAAALAVDLAITGGKHVRKTVFGGPTLLFVGGLEGTGHHFWQRAHADIAPAPAVTAALAKWIDKRKSVCGEKGSAALDCRIPRSGWLKGATADLKRAMKDMKHMPKRLYLIGGSLPESYPACRDGPRAIFQHPDLQVLAELAEESGVDIRFLIATRSAEDMLLSDVTNRQFCRGADAMERQTDYLSHNAHVLTKQLQSLDTSFFVHASYDDLPAVPDSLQGFYETALAQPKGGWQMRINGTFKPGKSTRTLDKPSNFADLLSANEELVRVAKEGHFLDAGNLFWKQQHFLGA
jgi:hypothetical protein